MNKLQDINFIQLQQINEKDNFNECCEEYNEEVKLLCDDIEDIATVYKSIQDIVKNQQEHIDTINTSTEKTVDLLKEANINLTQAELYQQQFSILNMGLVATVGLITANIPIVLFFGLKVGLITSLSTVGTVICHKIYN